MNKQSEGKKDSIIIKTENLCKNFGRKCALNDVTIEVLQGRVFGLVGENGAGKTTLFNLLLNFIRSDSGRVLFDGEPIHHLPPYRIARMGMVR
ncbi:MAG: ATP-binding cassette domain-containing protein, partial [Candidatus Hydrogenedens sp.]